MAIPIGSQYSDREKRKKQRDANDRGLKVFLITITVIYVLTAAIATAVITPRVMKTNWKYENGEIVIQHDIDFSLRYNLPGLGTLEDPYRLENLTLQSNKSWGIYIEETTKYFIIRNCTIKANQTSIHISNIAFGTAVVENNTCLANSLNYYTGIKVEYSSGTKILRNILKYEFLDNGHFGISLYDSSNCIISENKCDNFRVGISCRGFIGTLDIRNNICNKNHYSGISIHSYDYTSYYAIDAVIIYNNTCSMNSLGMDIQLEEKFQIFIIENNCSNNSIVGLSLYDYGGSDCLLTKNQIIRNGIGIRIFDSFNVTLEYNHIEKNSDFGLILNAVYFYYVYQNNFLFNNLEGQSEDLQQVADSYQYFIGDHFWYNNATKKGNYWSDLVWSETAYYNITYVDFADLYPLKDPVDIFAT